MLEYEAAAMDSESYIYIEMTDSELTRTMNVVKLWMMEKNRESGSKTLGGKDVLIGKSSGALRSWLSGTFCIIHSLAQRYGRYETSRCKAIV